MSTLGALSCGTAAAVLISLKDRLDNIDSPEKIASAISGGYLVLLMTHGLAFLIMLGYSLRPWRQVRVIKEGTSESPKPGTELKPPDAPKP
jgi:hypothetical protein